MRPIPPPVALALAIGLCISYIVIYELVLKLINNKKAKAIRVESRIAHHTCPGPQSGGSSSPAHSTSNEGGAQG